MVIKTRNNSNAPLRFAMLGCGFWGRYQLAAWNELPEATCVALYNRTRNKAEELAREFHVPTVYSDAEEMFRHENLDFVDIVTDVNTHVDFLKLAMSHGVPAICQKPLAPSFEAAEVVYNSFREAGLLLYVHENWRWQRPIRAVKRLLDEGRIGTPFRCRIEMITGFPVFQNQPLLRDLERLIVADLGTHILDVARYLFGEAETLYCETHRVHPGIRGEDVATVAMSMGGGRSTIVCNLAYAGNPLEHDSFPQTLIFIEAGQGSLELASDFWVRITNAEGTFSRRYPPTMYPWLEPAYAVVQSSIVDCHKDLVRGFREADYVPETCAAENLKTLRLVYDAYESDRERKVVHYS